MMLDHMKTLMHIGDNKNWTRRMHYLRIPWQEFIPLRRVLSILINSLLSPADSIVEY